MKTETTSRFLASLVKQNGLAVLGPSFEATGLVKWDTAVLFTTDSPGNGSVLLFLDIDIINVNAVLVGFITVMPFSSLQWRQAEEEECIFCSSLY